MNEAKKSPKVAFIVAGILFLINGIISFITCSASFLSALISIFDGFGWTFIGMLFNGVSILNALSVCALGIVLLINRKNTKAVVIAAGVTFGFAVVSFIFNLASQFNTYIPIFMYSYTLYSGFYTLLFTISGIVGVCVPLLLFLLAMFNLRGSQKICKLWFVPIIVKVISYLLWLVYDIFQSWLYSSALYFDFADFIVGIIRNFVVTGFGNLLGLLSLGFLCFALRRVVTEEPGKIEESSETEAIEEPIPSPENEIQICFHYPRYLKGDRKKVPEQTNGTRSCTGTPKTFDFRD